MFSLCSTCDDIMKQDDSTRSDKERCIVETWIVDEFRMAVDGLWLGVRVWILGVWENVLRQTPIQEVFSQST
jgi:hypothetical protein